MQKPPCSKWKLWFGKEIEGYEDVGQKTIFVRDASYEDIMTVVKETKATRIWFCKEYRDWKTIRRIERENPQFKFCVEANQKTVNDIPSNVVSIVRVYFKLDLILPAGSVLCVGAAFNDEAFVLGKGRKVVPDQYGNDECVIDEHGTRFY
jgi:hypothetical protein